MARRTTSKRCRLVAARRLVLVRAEDLASAVPGVDADFREAGLVVQGGAAVAAAVPRDALRLTGPIQQVSQIT